MCYHYAVHSVPWVRKDDYHCGFSENTAEDKPVFAKPAEQPIDVHCCRLAPCHTIRREMLPPPNPFPCVHVAHLRVPAHHHTHPAAPFPLRQDGLRSQRRQAISFAHTARVMLHPVTCGLNCLLCDRLWSMSSRPFRNRLRTSTIHDSYTI